MDLSKTLVRKTNTLLEHYWEVGGHICQLEFNKVGADFYLEFSVDGEIDVVLESWPVAYSALKHFRFMLKDTMLVNSCILLDLENSEHSQDFLKSVGFKDAFPLEEWPAYTMYYYNEL